MFSDKLLEDRYEMARELHLQAERAASMNEKDVNHLKNEIHV